MSQDTKDDLAYKDPLAPLSSWVVTRVDDWEEHRNTNYLSKWDEYYRIWRGIWQPSDKTRESENSKIISPATQQAVDATVSELEEAVFGRSKWFDMTDDQEDPDNSDIVQIRTNLQEDLERSKVKDAIVETMLNGAIYGTGIAMITVDEKVTKEISTVPIEGTLTTDTQVTEVLKVEVKVEPLTPKEFVIDPSATSIDGGLGVARIVMKPKYEIVEAIAAGVYNDVPLGSYDTVDMGFDEESDTGTDDNDTVKITEYWGRVPAKYLSDTKEVSLEAEFDYEEDVLIEACVTIANDGVVLKAVENPYLMGDRPFIAYQHDRIPNKFWGRGIPEKGYNPQKALDAELRARVDTLALTTHPMMGVDATRLPRGVKFEVKAGKTILTNGDPRQTLMPLNFGTLATSTFTEAAELERMVQMGTGILDSATSPQANARNDTASGMSMVQAGSIKRQKRTLMNFQENFFVPMINKVAWRYMQFAPDRYPAADYKFQAYSTMGIMAKELEMTQMVQLLSMTQAGTPAHAILMMSIFENSSMSNKEEMKAAMQQSMQPDPKQVQVQEMMTQLTLMKAQMEIEEMKAKATKDMALAQKALADAQDKGMTEAEVATIQVDLAEKMAKIEKLRIEAQNIQSETWRNIPEVEFLKSETVLNYSNAAAARSKANAE